MRTRNLCAVMMMTGISLLAFSCSKQDQDELLNTTNNKTSTTATTRGPAAAPVDANASWKTVGTNFFSVQVPTDWNLREMGAMDTYTGIIYNGTNTLHYDHGRRNMPYQIDGSKFTYTYERVDGKMAKMISSRNGGQYGICIDSVKVMTDNNGNVTRVTGFMLMSKEGERMDEGTVMAILRSVRFK